MIDKELNSPLSGQVIKLDEVDDMVFSSGMMGDGVAVIPDSNKLFAPADGVVDTIFATKHAFTMYCDNGAELLIHVGLDTVKLEGKPFKLFVDKGQHVSKGQLILEFDADMIRKADMSLTTPIILCNSKDLKYSKIEMGLVNKDKVIITLK